MSTTERRSIRDAKTTGATGPESNRGALTRAVAYLMPRLEFGHLVIETPSGERLDISGLNPGVTGTVVIHRWRALWRCIAGGELGFAEAYMSRECSPPNLRA